MRAYLGKDAGSAKCQLPSIQGSMVSSLNLVFWCSLYCTNLANMELHFPEFTPLSHFRFVLAIGEMCVGYEKVEVKQWLILCS